MDSCYDQLRGHLPTGIFVLICCREAYNSENYKPLYSELTQKFLLGDVHVVGHNSYPPGRHLQYLSRMWVGHGQSDYDPS